MSEEEKTIHKGHRERMRKRFYEGNGFDGFAEHEILEYILFSVYKRGNTNVIAHRLLKKFGSLSNVLCAGYHELMEVEGIGPKSAEFICMLRGVCRAFQKSRLEGTSLMTMDSRCEYFLQMLSFETDEAFTVVCLDDKMCVVHDFIAAKGTPGKVSINMQYTVRTILNIHCTMVMLAHNHPKGRAMASYDDIQTTNHIAKVLHNLGIKLVDHVIVADGKAISMLQQGNFVPISD